MSRMAQKFKMYLSSILVIVLFATILLPQGVFASPSEETEQLIVKFKKGKESMGKQKASTLGMKKMRKSSSGAELFVLPKDQELSEVVEKLKKDSSVEYVEVNSKSYKVLSSDPMINDQWAVHAMEAPLIWDSFNNTFMEQIVVAVVDTGVDFNHPDLAGRLLPGANFASEMSDGSLYNIASPIDDDGHGTNLAGIIGAVHNNQVGISGIVGPANVAILPVKVLDNEGWGYNWDIAQGIYYAVDAGADIINLSLGGVESSYIAEAINHAQNQGVLVVAAAGNEDMDVNNFFPASLPGVLTVGSIDQSLQRATYSNWGAEVELMAPGEGVLTTSISNDPNALGDTQTGYYSSVSGTSFATGFVSGAAALLKAKNPWFQGQDLYHSLIGSAEDLHAPGWDAFTGYGYLSLPMVLKPSYEDLRLVSPLTNSLNFGEVELVVESWNPKISNVKFYVNDITEENFIAEGLLSPTIGNFTATWNSSQVPDGPYSLIAVGYDVNGMELARTMPVPINVQNQSLNGMTLKILDPLGRPANNAWVEIYDHLEERHYWIPPVPEEEKEQYVPHPAFQGIYFGETDFSGTVRLPNTFVHDLENYYVVVRGHFTDINGQEAPFCYFKEIEIPTAETIGGKSAIKVSLEATDKTGSSLSNTYFVSIPNTTKGAFHPIDLSRGMDNSVYMLSGNYDLIAKTNAASEAYFLWKPNQYLSDLNSKIVFDGNQTGQVSFGAEGSNSQIFVRNQAPFWWAASMGRASKLNVLPGSYYFSADVQVDDQNLGSWVYTFNSKKVDIQAKEVKEIEYGGPLSIDTFYPVEDNLVSWKSFVNRFKDAFGNNLMMLVQGNLALDGSTLYRVVTEEGQEKQVVGFTANNKKVTAKSISGRWVYPELMVTAPDGVTTYSGRGDYFLSEWWPPVEAASGLYTAELSLEANPLAPLPLKNSTEFTLDRIVPQEPDLIDLTFKDSTGNPISNADLNVYRMDGYSKQWSNYFYIDSGKVTVDQAVYSSGDYLGVLSFTKDSKKAIAIREFQSFEEIANFQVKELQKVNLQVLDSQGQSANLAEPIQVCYPYKPGSQDYSVAVDFLDSSMTEIFLEEGTYHFNTKISEASLSQTNWSYLVKPNFVVSKDRDNLVVLDGRDVAKVDLNLDMTNYGQDYSRVLSPVHKYTDYYYPFFMGYTDHVFFSKGLNYNLFLTNQVYDSKANTHWDYWFEGPEILNLQQNFVWQVGGRFEPQISLKESVYRPGQTLVADSKISDAYGNRLTAINGYENAYYPFHYSTDGKTVQGLVHTFDKDRQPEKKIVSLAQEKLSIKNYYNTAASFHPYLRIYRSEGDTETRVLNVTNQHFYYGISYPVPFEWQLGDYRAELAITTGPLEPVFSAPEAGRFTVSQNLELNQPLTDKTYYSRSIEVSGLSKPAATIEVKGVSLDTGYSLSPLQVTADSKGHFKTVVELPEDGRWKISVIEGLEVKEVNFVVDTSVTTINEASYELERAPNGYAKLESSLIIKASGSAGAHAMAYVSVKPINEFYGQTKYQVTLHESQDQPGNYKGDFTIFDGLTEINGIEVAFKKNDQVDSKLLLNEVIPVGGSIKGWVKRGLETVTKANVRVSNSSGVLLYTVTDNFGEFIFDSLAPGVYKIRIIDTVSGEVITRDVTVTAGLKAKETFDLPVTTDVIFTLADKSGASSSFGGLELYLSNSKGFWQTTKVDANNQAKFTGLVPGTYQWITVGAGRLTSAYTDGLGSIEVGNSTQTPTIYLEKLVNSRGTIAGQVLDEQNVPVAGALVTAFSWNPNYAGNAITDENGRYELTLLEPGANYSLSVSSEGYQNAILQNIAVTKGGITTQDITLKKGLTLTGTVSGSLGPIVGVNLRLVDSKGNYYWSKSDGSGSYSFKGLELGEYSLFMDADPRMGYGGYEGSVSIASGENVKNLTLTRLGILKGKVTDSFGIPIPWVNLEVANSNHYRNTSTNAKGEFAFNLPAGTYKLSAFGVPGYKGVSAEDINVTDEATITRNLQLLSLEDQSKAFVGAGNGIKVNKLTAAPGDILTYRIDLKNNSGLNLTEGTLYLDLPAGLEYVKGSFKVDGNLREDIHFTTNQWATSLGDFSPSQTSYATFMAKVIAKTEADLVTKANVSWSSEDITWGVGLGSTTTSVVFTSISSSGYTNTGKVTTYGQGTPGSVIKVYQGSTLLGTSKVDGRWWSLEVSLPSPGVYSLWAQAELEGSVSAPSETVEVQYEANSFTIEDVEILGTWNGTVKLNPRLGLASMGLAELNPFEVRVKFAGDYQPDKLTYLWLGQEYTMTKAADGYYQGSTPNNWHGAGDHLLKFVITKDGEVATPAIALITVLIDPSGYVYEGVKSNRLSEVKAMVEQDISTVPGIEQWVPWDAAKFGMVNPQFTNKEGRYGWDVPQGRWRVIFSKEGYETHVSRVVNVPPPETELNINLISLANPELDWVEVQDGKLQLSFSKYMVVDSFTSDKVTFTASENGQNLTGTINPLNGEEEAGVLLSSKFEFVPNEPLDMESRYKLQIQSSVEDYTGRTLTADAVWADIDPKGFNDEMELVPGQTAVAEYNSEHDLILVNDGTTVGELKAAFKALDPKGTIIVGYPGENSWELLEPSLDTVVDSEMRIGVRVDLAYGSSTSTWPVFLVSENITELNLTENQDTVVMLDNERTTLEVKFGSTVGQLRKALTTSNSKASITIVDAERALVSDGELIINPNMMVAVTVPSGTTYYQILIGSEPLPVMLMELVEGQEVVTEFNLNRGLILVKDGVTVGELKRAFRPVDPRGVISVGYEGENPWEVTELPENTVIDNKIRVGLHVQLSQGSSTSAWGIFLVSENIIDLQIVDDQVVNTLSNENTELTIEPETTVAGLREALTSTNKTASIRVVKISESFEEIILDATEVVDETMWVAVEVPLGTTYYQIFVRDLRDIANLDGITVGGEPLTEFNQETFVYNKELPVGTTELPEVTVQPTDAKGTVTITPASGLPGTTTITVTAEDGVTTKTYTINFTVDYDPATISTALGLAEGQSVIDYIVNDQKLLMIKAGATVDQVISAITTGGSRVSVGVVTPSVDFTVVEGTGNTVYTPVEGATPVTSEMELAVKVYHPSNPLRVYYRIFIDTENVVDLEEVEGEEVVNSLSDEEKQLNIEPRTPAAQLKAALRAENPSATIEIVRLGEDGTETAVEDVEIVDGAMKVAVQVPIGTTYYTITVRDFRDIATLDVITVGGLPLTGFNQETLEYAVELPVGTNEVPVVTAQTTDAKATVIITSASVLPGTTTITVTAEDGVTAKTYTINFTVRRGNSGSNVGSNPGSGTTPPLTVPPIIKGKGGKVEEKGVTIEVPANAVPEDVKITIEKIENVASLPLDSKAQFVGDVFEIVKDKTGNFEKNITITLSFDKNKVDSSKYQVAIFWLNEETNKWVKLDKVKVDLTSGKVSGEVNHFTKFAVLAVEKPNIDLSDVTDHWAEEQIKELVALGAITGYKDGSFKPKANITRAEFATVLVKALELEAKPGRIFKDTANHWAKEYIVTADAHGIVNGYDGENFGANEFITREQMAVMLVRAAKLAKGDTNKAFADSDKIATWAKDAIDIGVNQGVITGYQDNTFNPKGTATRAEAVMVISKILNK